MSHPIHALRKYPGHPADGATYRCVTKVVDGTIMYSVDQGETWWLDCRAAAIAKENTPGGMAYDVRHTRSITVRSVEGFVTADEYNRQPYPWRFIKMLLHDGQAVANNNLR